MTLQLITVRLMLSNFHFFLGPSLSGIDIKIQNSPYSVFRNYVLNEIRPKPSPIYNINNPSGIKLLTRLRLGLSHLSEHKFNHNFDDCVNPFCTCSLEPESTSQFFLYCHH